MKRTTSILDDGRRWLFGVGLLVILSTCTNSQAFERYKERVNNQNIAGSNCSECHGDFDSATSPKGTVFPSNSKHEMHRDTGSMNTECDLCHSTGDNRNPFTYYSNGTANNAGLGCSGCHNGPGLRLHHAANGIGLCAECHFPEPETPPAEGVNPPYYGTPDTRAANPCNGIAAANTNENWSIGDFLGLDNDGNKLYDMADFACGPYRIRGIVQEGSNIRIAWDTAGGRRDAVQGSTNVVGPYLNLSSPIVIPGTGVFTTNYVEPGGATNPARFYRVMYVP